MLTKCGSKVVWHWAHHRHEHCDPWWENETQWHRTWKGYFPSEWREQVHFDENGEKHIADVKTPPGMVLEFQNSAISREELVAREQFYGKMLWIVNGSSFINQFYLLGRLPAAEAHWAQDIVFLPQQRDKRGRGYWYKSENPNHKPGDMVIIHEVSEIQDTIDRDYVGHHLYEWVRPRTVWFGSISSVFIDFGGDLLWHMRQYGENRLQCVQAVRKRTVVTGHGGDYIETGEIVRPSRQPTRNGNPANIGWDEVILDRIRVA
jgi:hypothetical protein